MKNKIEFEFLATMPLKEIDKSPSSIIGGKSPVDGADFRLFADGSIYPSLKRITEDQLEFQKKDSGNAEFGYDVFLSTDWGQYPGTIKFPCIAKVSKHLPKVDLFGRTKYGSNGVPKSTINTLKSTQGENLIKYLEESYLDPGEILFGSKTYVDLKINFETPVLETSNKIYNIPKKILKGKEEGKPVYERRENIVIYPLVMINPPVTKSISGSSGNNSVPKEIVDSILN